MNTSNLVAILNGTALATRMLSMGLRVGVGELLASARPARRLVLGLIVNYALVPVVTIGLLHLFRADPMVSVGSSSSRPAPAPRSGRRSQPSPGGMCPGPSG
jgi:predicted Na+-dependent transporter